MSEKILYLECNSGISGDMTVAALLDLGANREVLMEALESLPLTGYSIEIKDVYKSGIRACDFNVILDSAHENHDHDMEYLYGDAHTHDAAVSHEYAHAHADGVEEHEHAVNKVTDAHAEHTVNETPGTPAHHHHHDARNLNDIAQIIMAGRLTENAKSLALKIFRILAQAEAKVHGKSIDEVHFHEVGAVDSIVDITAAAVCLDNLQPDQVVISALTDGTGQIRCQHGLIPVPVPAVTAIASNEQSYTENQKRRRRTRDTNRSSHRRRFSDRIYASGLF